MGKETIEVEEFDNGSNNPIVSALTGGLSSIAESTNPTNYHATVTDEAGNQSDSYGATKEEAIKNAGG